MDNYKYILGYIDEAVEARKRVNALRSRAIDAYKGKPSKNMYLQKIQDYIETVDDAEVKASLENLCKQIPPASNSVFREAVDTMVSQAVGGIDKFLVSPIDGIHNDSQFIDKISYALKNIQQKNNIDNLMFSVARNNALYGSGAMYVQYTGKDDINEFDDYLVYAIPGDQMLIDPIFSSYANKPRFIGHTQVGSWRELKGKVKTYHKNDTGEEYLKDIEGVEIYLREIENEILITGGFIRNVEANDSVRQDLDTFYSAVYNEYKRYGTMTDAERNKLGRIKSEYQADDIEISYIYDIMNKKYFIVVNRKFIVHMEDQPLCKTYKVKNQVLDENGEEVEGKGIDIKISLDSPYASSNYMSLAWERVPTTPAWLLLDDFDTLCALETILIHTISIMSTLTLGGTPTDAKKVSELLGISGQIIASYTGSVMPINKVYDLTALTTEITRLEQRIRRGLNGTDAAQAMSMIGDRASAREVSAMNSMVMQGLNEFISNMETTAKKLGEIILKLFLIQGSEDSSLPYTNEDENDAIEYKDLFGKYDINVQMKPLSAVERNEQLQGAISFGQLISGEKAGQYFDVGKVMASIGEKLGRGIWTQRELDSFKIDPNDDPQNQMAQQQINASTGLAFQQMAQNDRAGATMDQGMFDITNGGQFSPEEVGQMLSGVNQSEPNYEMFGGEQPMINEPQIASTESGGIDMVLPNTGSGVGAVGGTAENIAAGTSGVGLPIGGKIAIGNNNVSGGY